VDPKGGIDFEDFFKRQNSAQAVMQPQKVIEPLINLEFKETSSVKQRDN
jgi:hypothetical protein